MSMRNEEEKTEEKPFDTTLYYSFGFENEKRNNLHFVEDSIVVFSMGNTLNFFNLKNLTYNCTELKGEDGIGAIAVSIFIKAFN